MSSELYKIVKKISKREGKNKRRSRLFSAEAGWSERDKEKILRLAQDDSALCFFGGPRAEGRPAEEDYVRKVSKSTTTIGTPMRTK